MFYQWGTVSQLGDVFFACIREGGVSGMAIIAGVIAVVVIAVVVVVAAVSAVVAGVKDSLKDE